MKERGLKRNEKGFTLSEISLAIVIILILFSILALSFISYINNSKAVRVTEQARSINSVLSTMDVYDISSQYHFEGIDEEVKEIISYHKDNGTNMNRIPFVNEIIKTDRKNYIGGLTKDNKDNFASTVDLASLEVRKIDLRKMNGYLNGELKEDWYIVMEKHSQDEVITPPIDDDDDIVNPPIDDDEDEDDGDDLEDKQLTCDEAKAIGYDYCIKTPVDLINVKNDLNGKYIIVNDINLSRINWDPIGTKDNKFNGEINGNGYTIKSLTIAYKLSDFIGLFGHTGSDSIIDNVSLDTVYIQAYSQDGVGSLVGQNEGKVLNSNATNISLRGNRRVGGLVGVNQNGEIINSFTVGEIQGNGYIGGLVGRARRSTITDSYSQIEVEGESTHGGGGYIGGLIGYMDDSQVIKSHSISNIEGNSYHVGGLVGHSQFSEIKQSYSMGSVMGRSVIGGLVGLLQETELSNSYSGNIVKGYFDLGGLIAISIDSKIEKTFSYGRIERIGGSDYTSIGGLVGRIADRNSNSEVNNSYWNILTSGVFLSDGGIGSNTYSMKNMSNYPNWDFINIWEIEEGKGYPYLRFERTD